ncbi:NERD domain-containing protein [Bacillus timonensis]|nr:NERD domain-containing protein [Bacillus timonensis]
MAGEFISLLIVVVAFAVVGNVLNSKGLKGFLGEASVSLMLSRLGVENYTIFNDLTIRKPDGGTSQIDHVVVSNFGIFVIETKNYQGWIFGDEWQEQWTQSFRNGKKKRISNPIHQNYGHIKALMEYLGEEDESMFYSIICFGSRATLKKVSVNNPQVKVISSRSLISTIKSYKEMKVSYFRLNRYGLMLEKIGRTDRTTRKEHIEHVKQAIQVKKNKVAADICPKCGEDLVIRKSKFGSFKGCSNYPSCRFVVKRLG